MPIHSAKGVVPQSQIQPAAPAAPLPARPAYTSPIHTLAGDVVGRLETTRVVKLQGFDVQVNDPKIDDVIKWDGEKFVCGEILGGGFFDISTFVNDVPVMMEVGDSLGSVTLGMTYSATPESASITDNLLLQGANLTAPFDTYESIGPFVKNEVGSVIFTLTATRGSTTRSKTTSVTWGFMLYYGADTSPAPDAFTEGFIIGLEAFSLAATAEVTFDVTLIEGQKAYFCMPTSFVPGKGPGDPSLTFYVDDVLATFNIMDDSPIGVTVNAIETDYNIYESDGLTPGTVTVRVVLEVGMVRPGPPA